jgi:PilZ domain-containing protein
MSERSDKPVVLPDSGNLEAVTTEIPERRRTARYSFIATAEVYEIQSQTRVTGRCSDLSMGGCYVDTLAPFAVGSPLRIVVRHDAREFHANGAVTYAHPSMGMGIAFKEIKDDSKDVLRFWIADMAGDPIPEPEPLKAPSTGISSGDSESNIRLVLNELITLLVRKKILTDMEGVDLLIQGFR